MCCVCGARRGLLQASGLVRSKTYVSLSLTCELPKGAHGEPKNVRSRQRGPRLVPYGLLTGRRERASHISLVLGRFSRSLERAACELGHASRRFSPVRWRYLSRLRPCRRSFSDKVFSRVESLAIVVILVGSEAT
jgi:hypothetical protein